MSTTVSHTLDALYQEARDYLRREYAGVFDEEALANHFRQYVLLPFSQDLLASIHPLLALQEGRRLLDLGCGFGSFVLAARQAGFEAQGLDMGDFQVKFARQRLAIEAPEADPEAVYLHGDAQHTGLPAESYDVITAWNLLEHVPDCRQLLREAHRLLRPGGILIGIAPNYLAFRREAHYRVPWLPLLPRPLASAYLRALGRRPDFFQKSIYYVTNWGVLRALRQTGFSVVGNPAALKLEQPELIKSDAMRRLHRRLERWRVLAFLRLAFRLNFRNPFKLTIYFMARKDT